MGTAILRSHDCLQGRFRNDALAVATSHVRSRRNCSKPSPNFNSYTYQNRRRKRSPVAAVHANYHHDRDRSLSVDRSLAVKGPAAAANLVMGQVKILKRGEKLSPENGHRGLAVPAENRKTKVKSEEDIDLFLGSTDRLGPDPATVQKHIRVSDSKAGGIGIYAGSAFVTSPPPSSVPVPVFLGKNGAATSDLRRLLRLDLE